MAVLSRFDPWVLPLLSYRLSLPYGVEDAEQRLSPLVADPLKPTTDAQPFRGSVKGGEARLTVKMPTSGLASTMIQHERTLAVVHGRIEPQDGGCHVDLVVRQPLPAFVVLALVWLGFVYTVLRGAEPMLLFMPVSGHTILLFFFRMTVRERALNPIGRVLGETL